MADVTVTQEAREAAADALIGNAAAQSRAAIRAGEVDDHRLAQAFAKAIAAERERCAGIAENYCCENQAWSTPAGSLGDYIATAIRGSQNDG